MKKILLIASIAFASYAIAQSQGKVGINTTTPKASLDINVAPANAAATATTPEGILIPRVTRERLINMGTGTAIETSTLVFVSEATTGTATGTAVDVTTPGFYYYNGTKWVTLGSSISNGNFILNQYATQQAANFNINGNGKANYLRAGNDNAGYATLSSGGTNAGYLEIWNADNTRAGYIGFVPGQMRYNADQGNHIFGGGNVGINTNSPSTKLHVDNGTTAGAIRIVDGTQGANKVLTSDANGVGTWQTATAAANGNFILNQNATEQAANYKISGNGQAASVRGGIDGGGYAFLAGGGANNAGYLDIRKIDNSRVGYIGYLKDYMFYQSDVGNHVFGGTNVGIGESNPTSKLHITGSGGANIDLKVNGRISTGDTGNAGGMWIDGANTMFMGQHGVDTMGFYGNGTDVGWNFIMNKTTGNVGIGTATPTYGKLDVRGGAVAITSGTTANPYLANATLYLSEDGTVKSPRIEFHSAGFHEGFIELARSGDRRFILNDTQGVGMNLEVFGYVKTTAVDLNSDQRLKTDIKPLISETSTLSKLTPVSYYWNDEGKKKGGNDKLQYGFIAQQVEKVLPNLVNTDNNGYKSVNYIEVIPILTKSVQDLTAENTQLKAKLEALEKKVDALISK